MAEQIYNVKCGFFDAVNNDRVYTAEDMNRLYKRVIHDGVFPDENNNPSDDLLVEAESGMTITVNPGEGVFANRWFKNTIEIPIDVPTNSSNDRIDSVIIQVDTRKSGRAGNIVYRTGEPSINPAPPQINEVLGVVEYRLANISVASGTTAITSADITDLRGTSECPWVTGIVSANDIPPNSVTEAKLATDAVTSQKIHSGAVTQGKLGVGAVETANIDGGAVTLDKLDSNTVYEATPTSGSSKLLTSGGAYTALAGISVGENQIDDGAVTYNKFAPDALNYINGKLPYSSIVKNVGGVAAPVDITYLNSLTFDKKTFYYVWFAVNALFDGSPREWCIFLQLEADYQIVIRPNGDIYYREYSNAQWSDFNKKGDEKADLPDYSIGFNTDGIAVKKTTSTIMGAGTFLSGIKSIYLSENVTTLQDGFFNTASDLTDLYVDSDSVEMPTVPARVTVHNKGTFVVSDLLINSMIASNNEILDIKATITQVNTTLENAINGVSE